MTRGAGTTAGGAIAEGSGILTRMSNPKDSALAFAGPIVNAQMAWSALRGHGIEAVLVNQNAAAVMQPDAVQVLVPKAELPRALEVLVGMGLASASTRDDD